MDNSVKIFMEAAGQMVQTTPGFTEENNDQAFLYKELVREEFSELDDAFQEKDIIGVADACADLVWVIQGLAHTLGINFDAVWHQISQSNMSKVPADGKILRRADGKILKPDTYFPPNIPKALGL